MTSDVRELIERLNDEAMRLQGRSIDRGCVDSGLAGNLALEVVGLIESLSERIAVLEGENADFRKTWELIEELAGKRIATRASLTKEGSHG